MIIEIKEDLLTEVARFAWEFERQQETCSFPKYKDFGDLYERFSKSLNDNEDKILKNMKASFQADIGKESK